MKKSFAYYCSSGASRIIKFYSNEDNKIFTPTIVIYDGEREDVKKILLELFKEKLLVIDQGKLSDDEKKRIHTYTSKYIHKQMIKHNVEYLLCFGNKILKHKFINDFKNKLINFHPSILPAFKGLNAIDQALNYGVLFIGNTAHYIDDGVDTGEIILQSIMLKEDFESYEDVLELQFPMLKIIFRDLLNYKIESQDIVLEIKNRNKKYFLSSKEL